MDQRVKILTLLGRMSEHLGKSHWAISMRIFGKAINAFRIKFASGFEIMALSSAPRGLRGKQGVVIIDEAAFVDQLGTMV